MKRELDEKKNGTRSYGGNDTVEWRHLNRQGGPGGKGYLQKRPEEAIVILKRNRRFDIERGAIRTNNRLPAAKTVWVGKVPQYGQEWKIQSNKKT